MLLFCRGRLRIIHCFKTYVLSSPCLVIFSQKLEYQRQQLLADEWQQLYQEQLKPPRCALELLPVTFHHLLPLLRSCNHDHRHPNLSCRSHHSSNDSNNSSSRQKHINNKSLGIPNKPRTRLLIQVPPAKRHKSHTSRQPRATGRKLTEEKEGAGR